MVTNDVSRWALVFFALLVSSCGGGGGGGASSPAPTVTFSASAANVATNGSVTLTWSSTDTSSCTASGGWSGALASSGSQAVTVAASTTYNITCAGAGGSASGNTSVTAYNQPAPTIAVDQSSVLSGTAVTTTWSATDATACTVSGGDVSSTALSGTSTNAVSGSTTFTISCTNPVFNTPVTATAAVSVTDKISLTVQIAAQAPGDPVVNAAGTHYVPDWAHPKSIAVPYVAVLLEDAAAQQVLQSVYADDKGNAQFTGLAPGTDYVVVVESRVQTASAPLLDFAVLDNTGTADTTQGSFRARYLPYVASSSYSAASSGSANRTLALTAGDGWNSASSSLVDADRIAAPFVLLAYAVNEAQIVSSAIGQANPVWRPLTILWSVANKGGLTAPPNSFDQGAITGSGGVWSAGHKVIAADGTDSGATTVLEDYIYLSGDPTFEAMDLYPFAMSHEMGHFVQSQFSTKASPGGAHSYSNYEDFELAWVEGSASGIAFLVLDSPQERRSLTANGEIEVLVYDHALNTINGNAATWPVGWYQESTVSAFIWATHSTMGLTRPQSLAPLFSAAWQAGPFSNSVWSYATLLKQGFPSISGAVDTFSAANGFITAGSDAYGAGETNAGNRTARDVLPPTTPLSLGQSITLCSAGAALEYNRAGNRRYFRLMGDSASHTLTVQGPANTVPLVSHNGTVATNASATLSGAVTETPTGSIYAVGECGVTGGQFASQIASCGDPTPPAEQCWTIGYQ